MKAILVDEGAKHLLMSKTFWGAAIAVVSAVGGLFGHALAPADQAIAIDAIGTIGTGIGSLFAVYGRWAATKVIG